MNDTIDRQLQNIVDTTLRAVRASARRKQQMQEELLVHVAEVFADELDYLDDERAALAATRRRFGAVEEVGSQLQQSIPLLERLFLIPEKELFMSTKFWLAAVFAIATGPAIILPAMAKLRDENILQLVPFMLGGAVLLAGLSMVAYGVVRHFARHA